MQVVGVLNYIIQGDTTCIQEFSPAHESDSVSSTMDSAGSQGNTVGLTNKEESLGTPLLKAHNNSNQKGGWTLSSLSRTSTSSGKFITYGGKSREKTRDLSLNKSAVLYNEMII